MRRAKLEGRHIGRHALELDEIAIQKPASRGRGLRDVALDRLISTASIRKVLGYRDAVCVEKVENQVS
jgi:hypothetical protein